jgi:hypothetical protein
VRVLEGYLEAIALEHEVDALYHGHFGLRAGLRLIPHGFAILGTLRRFEWPLRLAAPALLVLWCTLLQPVAAFAQAVRWSVRLGPRRRGGLPRHLYLAASNPRNLSFVDPADPTFPRAVIKLPFYEIDSSPFEGAESVDLRALTTRRMLFAAAGYSALAGWTVLARQPRLGLYGYMAFNWFWVYLALRELRPETVWVTNHFDRWLVLASAIPSAATTIVQHGTLYHELKDGYRLVVRPTRKVRNVTRIHVLDDESPSYFRELVDAPGLEFVPLRLATRLEPWRPEGRGKVRVLIIGNQGDLDVHARLVGAIVDRCGARADVAYRYHPLQRKRLQAEPGAAGGVWELSGAMPVPEPDIVVSYGSSLDREIAAASRAAVLRYDWDADMDLDTLIDEVATRIANGDDS